MRDRISRDPRIMLGKPCVRGTRITVELILAYLGDGLTVEQIIEAHPQLSADDIRAAATYAAEYLAQEGLVAAE